MMTAESGSAAERAVAAVIIANTVLLVWGLVAHDELAEHLETGCLVFFAAELAVRLWKARLSFFHSPWRCVDCIVIVVALAPILGADASLLRLVRLSRMVHWLRHVGHLRIATRLGRRLRMRTTRPI